MVDFIFLFLLFISSLLPHIHAARKVISLDQHGLAGMNRSVLDSLDIWSRNTTHVIFPCPPDLFTELNQNSTMKASIRVLVEDLDIVLQQDLQRRQMKASAFHEPRIKAQTFWS